MSTQVAKADVPVGLIHQLIPKISGEIGPIFKDGFNESQKFRFRGIDQFFNCVWAPLYKNGVFVTAEVVDRVFDVRQKPDGRALYFTRLTMRFTFRATDGSSVSTESVGEAMDSGDKATNKAMSSAYKYALMVIFNIPTDGVAIDPDQESHETKAPDPQPNQDDEFVKDLSTALEAVQIKGRLRNSTIAGLKTKFSVNTLLDLDPDRRQQVLEEVRRMKPQTARTSDEGREGNSTAEADRGHENAGKRGVTEEEGTR